MAGDLKNKQDYDGGRPLISGLKSEKEVAQKVKTSQRAKKCSICSVKLADSYIRKVCVKCTDNISKDLVPSLKEELKNTIREEIRSAMSDPSLANHKDKTVESQHVDCLEDQLQESQMRASEDTFCSESTESPIQNLKQENARPETPLQGNVTEDIQQHPTVQLLSQDDTDFPNQNQIFIRRPESPDVVREGIASRKFTDL
ncbi:uncharacterized protein LOC120990753 [Bufo bufo]|uniref:uncharacterized protein LOC120990753 n=1 Tax=Bufo bufo TaxID=8384 RepID=UPI001ABE57D1|nr:uncharacterized protein LOC120990753 [Bufo bufo]